MSAAKREIMMSLSAEKKWQIYCSNRTKHSTVGGHAPKLLVTSVCSPLKLLTSCKPHSQWITHDRFGEVLLMERGFLWSGEDVKSGHDHECANCCRVVCMCAATLQWRFDFSCRRTIGRANLTRSIVDPIFGLVFRQRNVNNEATHGVVT